MTVNELFFDLILEKDFKYEDEDRKKPAVPKRDDQPIFGLKTNKNFITSNAVENIMSVPKKPEKNYVDTKKGDKNPLEPSGLEPKYIHKKVLKIVFDLIVFLYKILICVMPAGANLKFS